VTGNDGIKPIYQNGLIDFTHLDPADFPKIAEIGHQMNFARFYRDKGIESRTGNTMIGIQFQYPDCLPSSALMWHSTVIMLFRDKKSTNLVEIRLLSEDLCLLSVPQVSSISHRTFSYFGEVYTPLLRQPPYLPRNAAIVNSGQLFSIFNK
jgi:hypothetical protein